MPTSARCRGRAASIVGSTDRSLPRPTRTLASAPTERSIDRSDDLSICRCRPTERSIDQPIDCVRGCARTYRSVRRGAGTTVGATRRTQHGLVSCPAEANVSSLIYPTWEPIRIPALCYLEAHLKLSSAGQERTVAKRASFGICGARAGGGDGGSCLGGTASAGGATSP